MIASTDSLSDVGDLFVEPADYRRKEAPPRYATYTLSGGPELRLRLVGHNPLWGHELWNAGRVLADFLQDPTKDLVRGRTVLELGAGAGLPGLVCALKGASKVLLTDYPDHDLIENLQINADVCRDLMHGAPASPEILVQGYLWGNPLVEAMDQKYDLLLLADLVFNHSEHTKLLSTIQLALQRTPTARALVFFTPHRPWLLDKDLAFFELARNSFHVEKIQETLLDKPMFAEDQGDEVLRRTVYGYELRWLPG